MADANVTVTFTAHTLSFRAQVLISGWEAASLTDPPSLHPDWLAGVLEVLREAGLSTEAGLNQPARALEGRTAAGHSRGLLELYGRSGNPERIPDTPAGRMWLREAVKILREVAHA